MTRALPSCATSRASLGSTPRRCPSRPHATAARRSTASPAGLSQPAAPPPEKARAPKRAPGGPQPKGIVLGGDAPERSLPAAQEQQGHASAARGACGGWPAAAAAAAAGGGEQPEQPEQQEHLLLVEETRGSTTSSWRTAAARARYVEAPHDPGGRRRGGPEDETTRRRGGGGGRGGRGRRGDGDGPPGPLARWLPQARTHDGREPGVPKQELEQQAPAPVPGQLSRGRGRTLAPGEVPAAGRQSRAASI